MGRIHSSSPCMLNTNRISDDRSIKETLFSLADVKKELPHIQYLRQGKIQGGGGVFVCAHIILGAVLRSLSVVFLCSGGLRRWKHGRSFATSFHGGLSSMPPPGWREQPDAWHPAAYLMQTPRLQFYTAFWYIKSYALSMDIAPPPKSWFCIELKNRGNWFVPGRPANRWDRRNRRIRPSQWFCIWRWQLLLSLFHPVGCFFSGASWKSVIRFALGPRWRSLQAIPPNIWHR